MPQGIPIEPPLTGLLRAAWQPKKRITVLWRRVATISPDAYDDIMTWLAANGTTDDEWPWLTLMATNEVTIEAMETLAELQRLLHLQPPPSIAEQVRLLHDLIWEASEASNDWLTWRSCRVCGRRWATAEYVGLVLCPVHANAVAIDAFLREEMERFPGLVDHSARLAALAAHPTPLVAEPPRIFVGQIGLNEEVDITGPPAPIPAVSESTA